jgi:hypothetical protein
VFSSPGNTASQGETFQPNRREIEGECGICLNDLDGPQDEDLDAGEGSENSGGYDHGDNDQDFDLSAIGLKCFTLAGRVTRATENARHSCCVQ